MSTHTPARVQGGAPDGGQFATSPKLEPDVALAPTAVETDDTDEYDDEDRCPCGESLDDGEGSNGLCGNCADRLSCPECGEEKAEEDDDLCRDCAREEAREG